MSQCHWQLPTRLGLPYLLSKIAFARASCDVEEALLVYHWHAISKFTLAIATWLHLASPLPHGAAARLQRWSRGCRMISRAAGALGRSCGLGGLRLPQRQWECRSALLATVANLNLNLPRKLLTRLRWIGPDLGTS